MPLINVDEPSLTVDGETVALPRLYDQLTPYVKGWVGIAPTDDGGGRAVQVLDPDFRVLDETAPTSGMAVAGRRLAHRLGRARRLALDRRGPGPGRSPRGAADRAAARAARTPASVRWASSPATRSCSARQTPPPTGSRRPSSVRTGAPHRCRARCGWARRRRPPASSPSRPGPPATAPAGRCATPVPAVPRSGRRATTRCSASAPTAGTCSASPTTSRPTVHRPWRSSTRRPASRWSTSTGGRPHRRGRHQPGGGVGGRRDRRGHARRRQPAVRRTPRARRHGRAGRRRGGRPAAGQIPLKLAAPGDPPG